ncbi:MAG: hypothetical protein JXK08_07500 [Flavobacteriaceae bacterium]|jgi:hypothetical protein|nr:hypothetical protein [Flavobacteriaceae bacterium]
MKKTIALFALTLFSFSLFAQDEVMVKDTLGLPKEEVKLALSIGSVSGNDIARDSYSVSATFDFTYLTRITSNLQAGFVLSYTNLFNDVEETTLMEEKDKKLMSLGATFRFYNNSGKFYLGSDLAYGYGLGGDGGLLFRPRVGMDISNHSGVSITYADINDEFDLNFVTIGYEFTF